MGVYMDIYISDIYVCIYVYMDIYMDIYIYMDTRYQIPDRARYQICQVVPGRARSCQVPDRARYLIVPGTRAILSTPELFFVFYSLCVLYAVVSYKDYC